MEATRLSLLVNLWGRLGEGVTAFGAAQTRRLFLWLPVALGAGSAFYLSLRFEPNGMVIGLALAILGVVVWLANRFNIRKYLTDFILLLFVFVLGFGLCKFRAERVAAPVLMSSSETHVVEAVVLDVISTTRDSPKLLIAPLRISDLKAKDTPIRIKVSLRPDALDDQVLRPGMGIRALMILHAPSGPVYPGGYDLSRQAYFEGVGAQGFAPGRLKTFEVRPTDWRLQWSVALNAFRWRLTQSLVSKIAADHGGFKGEGEEIGGFAAALVSGHQAYVTKSLLQSMRDSGLAHILSISGIHMAMVGGFSFFFCRWLVALCPPLALRFPIKKIAAGLGMVCVGGYLLISGAPTPAIRAAVVAWIAFAAILFDRQALTLRSLAIAALIVITLTPEAVMQPGFQMSFAATAALLALAEAQRPKIKEIDVPAWVRAWQAGQKVVGLSLVASLVAGAATTPFTLAFFNRLTPYGLISNLFEAPITGIVVMPSLFLGTLLSGSVGGVWLLKLAGLGLMAVRFISDQTASLPGSVVSLPSAPTFVAAMAMVGVLIVCLVRGPVRWAGLLIAVSIMIWPRVKAPDVWIDSEGSNAAIRTGNTAYALRPMVKLYGYRQWLSHYGLTSPDIPPDEGEEGAAEGQASVYAMSKDYDCKAYVCTPRNTASYKIGFAFGRKPLKADAVERLCQTSELIVLRAEVSQWPMSCERVNRLTMDDLARLGAVELTRQNGQWLIRAAMPLRGHRPWVARPQPDRLSDSGA